MKRGLRRCGRLRIVLMGHGSLPPEQRNILRFIFLDLRAHPAQYDRESAARMGRTRSPSQA